MTLRPPVVIGLVLATFSLPIAIGAKRLDDARDRVDEARSRVIETATAVQRVLDLRSSAQRVDEVKRPQQDLIARVNGVLAEAGLPTDAFGALTLSADAELPGSPPESPLVYKRQSVRINLKQLTLPGVGAFLAAWTRSQPLWPPSQIELVHPKGKGAGDRYDVTLMVEATYVAQRESR
jgi:hypothetical protein